MRVLFMGTPDFAVPTLQALIGSQHEVVGVVSQPDRARDRKGNIIFTDVKKCAVENNLPIWQFDSIKSQGIDFLRQLNADIFVTVAYGQILSQEILDIPKYGVINVHASLLPKYRGSSPIQWAVINGDKVTGISIMKTELGLDTGDVLAACEVAIDEDETAGELFDKLKLRAANLLVETLDKLENEEIVGVAQDETMASKCRMLTKEDGNIDWNKDAVQISNLVRGLNPWPTAYTFLNGRLIKIYKAKPIEQSGEAGEVIRADKTGLWIACGQGAIAVERLQLSGKREMDYKDFLIGNKVLVGDKFLNK